MRDDRAFFFFVCATVPLLSSATLWWVCKVDRSTLTKKQSWFDYVPFFCLMFVFEEKVYLTFSFVPPTIPCSRSSLCILLLHVIKKTTCLWRVVMGVHSGQIYTPNNSFLIWMCTFLSLRKICNPIHPPKSPCACQRTVTPPFSWLRVVMLWFVIKQIIGRLQEEELDSHGFVFYKNHAGLTSSSFRMYFVERCVRCECARR